MTLLGVMRLGRLLQLHWQRPSFGPRLQDYAQLTDFELETTARLVGALYATVDRFELFKELSLLYFAAASFSETARRLGKPQLADAFLLCRHPIFFGHLERICDSVSKPNNTEKAGSLGRHIHKAIEPFDVAGLTDRSRHPWYPAIASDLICSAAKFGVSEQEMVTMLEKCGAMHCKDK